jgi:tetratricopeptide (TPR) repeat protein
MLRHHLPMAIAAVALFCGMCVVENSAVSHRPADSVCSRNTSAVYAIAGEFRTVFANLLWIKAEQYHHEHIQRGALWSRNKELMGLIDLITALDPHFIEAYATGTYIYADGYRDYPRAINYLSRAIANNPKSWELHHIAAVLYAGRLHKPREALPYARLAAKYCKDSFYRRTTLKLLATIERLAKEQEAGDRARSAPKPK